MVTLHIEHAIRDYDTWQAAFERDPAQRQKAGVRQYRVFRPAGDAKSILVELDFDETAEAEAFIAVMRRIWGEVALSPGLERTSEAAGAPRTRILEHLQSGRY